MLWMLALAAVAFAQDAPPTADEQREFIAQTRRLALKYNETLPNFLCTQKTRRSVDYTGTGEHWQLEDTIEQQLTYFDRREKYKLLAVNEKPATAKTTLKRGVTSNGEFGSMLNQVFDPWVGTQFVWQRWDTLRGRSVAVYSLKVEQGRSRATIVVGSDIVEAGYQGFFFADRETTTVLRLIVTAEAPQKFPMQDISHVLDYGRVPIAGGEYILPLHSEMHARVDESLMRDGKKRLTGRWVLTRNEVDFVLYKKYSAEAAISFEK